MKIIQIKLNLIVPYAKNQKVHSQKQIKNVANSIQRFGFIQPLVIDKDNNIVIGHCRYEASKLLKLKEIPCVVVDNLTEDEIKALRIADNKLNESDWNMELVIEELKELKLNSFDITLTGFDTDLILEPEEKDDEVPEAPNPMSKLGDIYELGHHRIMCGDSTKIEDVEKLMDGKKADMVFTDPPYGMNLDVSNSNNLGGKGKWKNKAKNYTSVIGDDGDYDPTHLFEIFPDVKEMFLWGFDYFAEFIPKRKEGSVIVWDKRKGVEDMKLTFSEFELCWSREKHLREMVRITWSGILGTEQEFDHKRHHPTQKPIELSVWFVEKFSKEDWIIADLFLGSGSTLIACEKTNRICYGMELDPKYMDVIVQRYVNYTGNEKIKLNGKEIIFNKTIC